MPDPIDVQAAITQITADAGLYHEVVHGDAGTDVDMGGGVVVPSIAKSIAEIGEQIVTGFASGYVVIVANNAGRLAAVPAVAGQLLLQLDTLAIYYAPNTTMGSWVFHPVQNAAANAAAAVAAVTTLTASLAGKMDSATYVGGAASGVVHIATLVKELADYNAAHPNGAPTFYGTANGATAITPYIFAAQGVDLVDGVAHHSSIANTARRCQGVGTNFAFMQSPRRLVSWGSQGKFGTLGSGVSGSQGFFVRTVIAVQQPDRNLPNFNPNSIFTAAGQIMRVYSQGAATVILTQDGLVLAAGGHGQGVTCLFGSGVDKDQIIFMPLYFSSGGVNQPIKMVDVQDSTLPIATYSNACGVYVDTSDNVWLVTKNLSALSYGVGLTGAQNTPIKLNDGYPAWAGKIVKKVRCDCTGGVYVLFTTGELWAGGGNNAAGQLGTGGTSPLGSLLQIQTGVDDFDVSGQENGNTLALWILQAGTLKAAGYNINGQMAVAPGSTGLQKSFVTVVTNVDLVRMGGTDTISLFFRDATSGTWFALGYNGQGVFGEGAVAATNSAKVTLAALTLLIQDHGGLVNLVISGYNSKHSACAVMTDGTAWTCGNNTGGALGNGSTAAQVTGWAQVLWSPRDGEEKLVDCSAATGPSSAPAFTWRTNQGRILAAGEATFGFSTGTAPSATFNQYIASPIQFGVL